MQYLHQEPFGQTHQKDLKVLLLGRAHGRVLFMSSQEEIELQGLTYPGVTQMLLDISSSWFLLCQSHTDTSVGPGLMM